ncbi:hypothetical protein CA13_56220 [Planctomycetes bacterium CA13]|uniref:Uncharacterized protein n=1 Tax=Novipirellula herctigrandis TaxID=2527986 RepID=A0A5C5ZAL1_9BACT|nr:hypothetical protein CA13_56220 [Planctomycetes bacterium CA13]
MPGELGKGFRLRMRRRLERLGSHLGPISILIIPSKVTHLIVLGSLSVHNRCQILPQMGLSPPKNSLAHLYQRYRAPFLEESRIQSQHHQPIPK